MGASKDLFIKQKELAQSWQAVAKAEWFGRVIVHARGELMDSKLNADQLEGARAYESVLLTLADEHLESVAAPTPGLIHDLTVKRKTFETVKEK